MKDHYWDFRVGRWVRYVAPATPAELVPRQRSVGEGSTSQARPVTPVP